MSTESLIEWTDATWNPVRGCSRVSEGCQHCYAERVAHRFSGPGQPYHGLVELGRNGPRWNGEVRLVREALSLPLRWQKPKRIFVNSMSDLFHGGLSGREIASVFGIMALASQHTFQVLTKRSARMRQWFRWIDILCLGGEACLTHTIECSDKRSLMRAIDKAEAPPFPWPLPNVHLGASVENQASAEARIPDILLTPAAVRWISAEPLLGPLDLRPFLGKPGLNWVVVGGESGPGARPMDPDWVRSIRDQCQEARVPFFFKQWGGTDKKATGRELDGRTWDEMPGSGAS